MNYFGNSFGPQYVAGMPQNNYGMQTPQRCEVIRVNGRNGADAFRLAPNSSILMLDENEPLIWLKTTDGAGYATVAPYRIAPYQQPAPVDVNALDARIRALPSFREEQEKHERAEAKSRQRLVRYYTDHYNRLLPPPDATDSKLIPESWRGHTRHQVDSGTKKRAICEAYVKWRTWECGTQTLYEGYYKELMEQGEAAAACMVMELIRDVDEEIAGLDKEQIMLESMGYDLSVISGEELEKMRR